MQSCWFQSRVICKCADECTNNKAIRDGRPRPRATRWVGTFPYILTPIPNLYDHSFPRYGQITFLTFRRPTTLTFDLKFWKYLSVTVYPYVICMPSFIMIGWEMAEILHIEILRKHGQTHTQTDRQTDRHGHYNTSPSPYGGRGNEGGGWSVTLNTSTGITEDTPKLSSHYIVF